MCLSNIFPGNSEVITMLKECRMLKALLRDSFTAVNHLIDRIEKNFPGQMLEKIYVQTSASLGDNCIIIIERINQIEKLLEEKEFDVETRMDTNLFKELKDLNTRFEDTITKISNNKKLLTGLVIGFVFGLVFWKIMGMMGHTLTAFVLNFGMITTLVFGLIMTKVILVGTNKVLSVIYGEYERELDQAVIEHARAVQHFEPVARMFCWNICKVTELIEVHKKGREQFISL